MAQRSTAAALTRRHPLLALRLRWVWMRGRKARDASTLAAVRQGDPALRRVTLPGGWACVAELEFADGRIVRLAGVQRAAASVLDEALGRSSVELVEGAHPGPVWALYFRLGGGADGRSALLARSALVVSGAGGGGLGPGAGVAGPPPQLAGV